MSDIVSSSLIRRVRYTPLGDLLRGRVSGRLDVKARIEASKLSREGKDMVWGVIQRTRLWMGEKIEVAEELLAHFEDGRDGGESAAELIARFGDAKSVAKLIRRAKRRGRPILWHVLRAVGWVLVGLIVVYGFLAARFVLGRPTISVVDGRPAGVPYNESEKAAQEPSSGGEAHARTAFRYDLVA